MIWTAYGDPYSEETELLSRLSGGRHCSSCSCKISDAVGFVHRVRGERIFYVCFPCSDMFGWERPKKIQVPHEYSHPEYLRYYWDGLNRRNVL